MKQLRQLLATGNFYACTSLDLNPGHLTRLRPPVLQRENKPDPLQSITAQKQSDSSVISSWTEGELIQAYQKNGNLEFFGELYQRYAHLVFGTCIKYLKDPEAAKDAQMEIFHKLLDKLKESRPVNFNGWLHRVTCNHCLEILRKQSRSPVIEQIEGYEEVLGAEESNHVKERKLDRIVQGLMDMIKRLPQKQQECLRMFYLEKKSYKEIQDCYGYAYKEVKSHIQNGKRKLKKLLICNGYDDLWKNLAD